MPAGGLERFQRDLNAARRAALTYSEMQAIRTHSRKLVADSRALIVKSRKLMAPLPILRKR